MLRKTLIQKDPISIAWRFLQKVKIKTTKKSWKRPGFLRWRGLLLCGNRYQFRGLLHLHSQCWVEQAAEVDEDSREGVINFIDKVNSCFWKQPRIDCVKHGPENPPLSCKLQLLKMNRIASEASWHVASTSQKLKICRLDTVVPMKRKSRKLTAKRVFPNRTERDKHIKLSTGL